MDYVVIYPYLFSFFFFIRLYGTLVSKNQVPGRYVYFYKLQKKKKRKKKRKSINANIALNLHTNKAKQKIAEASTVGFEPAQA